MKEKKENWWRFSGIVCYYCRCPVTSHVSIVDYLVVGIRQFRLVGSWNKRYVDYIREKQNRDRTIASQYGDETIGTDDDSHDEPALSS
jgi:hypothetical protein